MTRRLQGKVVLVMGGGSDIGQVIALAFAQQGAKVVIAGLSGEVADETARKIQEVGCQAVFLEADVSRSDGAKALIERAIAACGSLDWVVNSRAIGGKSMLTGQEIAEVMMSVSSVVESMAVSLPDSSPLLLPDP